jgi:hypothetical protein
MAIYLITNGYYLFCKNNGVKENECFFMQKNILNSKLMGKDLLDLLKANVKLIQIISYEPVRIHKSLVGAGRKFTVSKAHLRIT